MKAVVYEKYGPPEVLRLKEVDKPIPKKNEILIKIHATTVTTGDMRMRKFEVPPSEWLLARLYLGLFKPRRKILGMELSGEVVAVGEKVTKYKEGDQVYAGTLGADFGGYAQYKCLKEDFAFLEHKPENITFEEAAAVPTGGVTALRFLRKAAIQPGEKVLIYGASGSAGTYAVQLAKYFGAEVTAICSKSNHELVRSLGADKVIDYTQEDFTQQEEYYDFIFDAVGKLPSKRKAKTKLTKKGRLISILSNAYDKRPNELAFLKQLIEEGKVQAVIDRKYPLEEIVEAHKYVEKGHKKGNVVITIPHEE